ncbi:Crp/Fnr family transcriptional regulator [Pseudomonas sp. GCM10022188]|uniref:Crp/Fnr family transcriptional regulator n=1 Tax=Pseudomonas TaxID=286 RepID=UPI001E49F633|nr:Crp/Fnr family transcriptional regulator [Pseudomonas oryzagri]MCC6075785.1 Crp/Fnr family transcriptional regulator [Pseudomonas oryzagri]
MSHPHPDRQRALLDQLPELARAALLEGFRPRRLVKGEMLGAPHGQRDSVFILRAGRIRVFLAFDDKEYTLAFLEPGDLYSTHSRAYLQAVGDSEVLVAETAAVMGRLTSLPGATPALLRVLGAALGNSMRIIEDLAFRDVEGRLARFLDGMLARKGVAQGGQWHLALDLTTEDIAHLLGTTRQTLSSLLNRLAREGILSRAGNGAFVVHRIDLLRARSQAPQVSAG